MKKRVHEDQGTVIVYDVEDEVWLPDGQGGQIKLEVADDAQND